MGSSPNWCAFFGPKDNTIPVFKKTLKGTLLERVTYVAVFSRGALSSAWRFPPSSLSRLPEWSDRVGGLGRDWVFGSVWSV